VGEMLHHRQVRERAHRDEADGGRRGEIRSRIMDTVYFAGASQAAPVRRSAMVLAQSDEAGSRRQGGCAMGVVALG